MEKKSVSIAFTSEEFREIQKAADAHQMELEAFVKELVLFAMKPPNQ